jgi:formylglycine-generating enzyme required for sulfatase activity
MQPRVKVERLQRGLREGLVTLLGDTEDALPVAERVQAGELLGDLGDPRLLDPATGDNFLNAETQRRKDAESWERYWCHIEQGPFWFGNDNTGELRQRELTYNFSIGRYLVTNAEYARFMEDGGYQERRWWTEQGWKYKEKQHRTQPRYWGREGYDQPNQPVSGLWWYEAMAYCAWLTEQGHSAGWLPHNEIIRLPTSLEWERAARHTDKRRYPWGDAQPTPDHANYAATGIGLPSPVGCFPRGAAVCGAQDMAGNVEEWLATPYGKDEQQEPQPDFAPSDRVLLTYARWIDEVEHLFCGSRAGSFADNRVSVGGVRLLRPLAHPNNSSDF